MSYSPECSDEVGRLRRVVEGGVRSDRSAGEGGPGLRGHGGQGEAGQAEAGLVGGAHWVGGAHRVE